MQNKYIHFCLKFDKLHDMSEEDFKDTNWLPFDQIVHQSLKVTVFNMSIMYGFIILGKSLNMIHKV